MSKGEKSGRVPWDSRVAFRTTCNFFERVSRETDKSKKLKLLAAFFRDLRAETDQNHEDLFPVLRLLLPGLDRERGAYGIKESNLAKLYIDMLQLGPASRDALKLKHFRTPKKSEKTAGDFAAVLFDVIKDRISYDRKKDDLKIRDLNDILDEIVKNTEGRKGIERILLGLCKKLSPVDQKWVVRIILKDMRLGLGTSSILGSFHPDAKELFEVNANLRNVASLLKDPSKRRNEIEIVLFEPFKPMLADRGIVKNIEKQMNHREFYIETKYDGERLQIHYGDDNRFKFYSRNGFDFSDDFRDFQRFLLRSFNLLKIHNVILDGEICAYNHVTKTLTQKGEQMNIRTLKSEDRSYQQCFYAYDILFLNDLVLTNKPLKERLEILKAENYFEEIEGRFHFADNWTGRGKSDVIEALNSAIDRREEGIVLKDPLSVYKPNARSKGGWIKIKPDYSDELMDTCDLLILGGYYGSGRRGCGLVSHFLLGLRDSESGSFLSFTRVGSGYSRKELQDLLMKLLPHFSRKPVDRIDIGRCDKPDVWIDPEKSVIVEIKAAEIVRSDQYKASCTLRFPRVERVRYDKDWNECMTVKELSDLRKQSDGKLTNRHYDEDLDESDEDSSSSPRKKKRRQPGGVASKAVVVAPIFRPVDTSTVMIETFDLKDKVIVIEPCNAGLKAELEKIVVKLGGTVEQNVVAGKTYCYVETGLKIRAKSVIKSEKFDVVKSDWLLECGREKFRPFRPFDMIYVTEKTRKEVFEGRFDKFGDGYFDLTTSAESLKYSLNKVTELNEEVELSHEDIAEFESKYYKDDPFEYGIFRPFSAYFDRRKEEEDFHPLEITELSFEFYGGKVETDLEKASIVVVHSSDTSRLKDFIGKKSVSEDWINRSIESGRVLSEKPFFYFK